MHYIAAAFPTACGKTNLAMLVSPLEAAGLEGVDGRRRHRLDARRARTAGCGRSTPRPASSASRPAPSPRRTRTRWPRSRRDTIFTNVAVTPRRRAVVGGQGRHAAREPHRLAGPALGPATGKAAHPNSRFTAPRASARHLAALGGPAGRADLGDHLRRPPRARRCRSCSRAVRLGRTASSSAPRWARRRPPPPPARSASCAATRWRCCRSAATTWATTSATGCGWASALAAPARDLPRQLVPHRTTTAGSSGRASARTCACCCG